MTGRGLRRHRSTLTVLAGLVAAVAVVVLIGDAGARRGVALDPDNPAPAGAGGGGGGRAARGGGARGGGGAAALDATEVAGATVLVTSTEVLGESTIARLVDHTRSARLVLAEPGPGTTAAFGISSLPYQVTLDGPRPAGCTDPAYAGLTVEVDEAVEYPVRGGCFAGEHGALLAEPRAGLVLLGAGELLSNGQVLRADDAAVALRLLGARDRLVWYVPSLDDLVADDGVSLATLLPRWLRPSLWVLALAALALLVWRARRLGPLATEPLPVVVKAIETTHSRGRLYRRAGDRAHAAEALRSAARARAADRLGLGNVSDLAVLVDDLARRTGRTHEDVEGLLGPGTPPPATDHDLIALAERLAELDREVRRP